MQPSALPSWLRPGTVTAAVACLALALAFLGARPGAGGWNDGSRLAAVESVLTRGTLYIDESPFCKAADEWPDPPPYYPSLPEVEERGTRDRFFIHGHFYSDKPAVIALLMAGTYRAGMAMGLPAPAQRLDVFCRVLTLVFSGLAFAVTLFCLHRLGTLLGLAGWAHTLWLSSFTLSTFALTYTRHVNSHILHLAVLAALCWQAVLLVRDRDAGRPGWLRLVGVGTLAGLGFNLDMGSGPLLCLAVGLWLLVRFRSVAAVAVVVASTLPWVAAGAGLNYAIGGVFKPLSMVVEYTIWPGSHFQAEEHLTGFWKHSPGSLALYSLSLLLGKRGLWSHNLPLLLLPPACVALWQRRRAREVAPHLPELAMALGWCVSAWLLYACLSNNSSGTCCSIRWFVPFLAPAYFALALYLRCQPDRWLDLAALSFWGAVLAAGMWWKGPWGAKIGLHFWPLVAAGLLSWAGVCRYRWRRSTAQPAAPELRQAA